MMYYCQLSKYKNATLVGKMWGPRCLFSECREPMTESNNLQYGFRNRQSSKRSCYRATALYLWVLTLIIQQFAVYCKVKMKIR